MEQLSSNNADGATTTTATPDTGNTTLTTTGTADITTTAVDGAQGNGDNNSATIPTPTDGEGDPSQTDVAVTLMFGDTELPAFSAPVETEREKALRLELEELKKSQTETSQRPQALTAEPQKPSRDNFISDEEYDAAFEQYVIDKGRWKKQEERKEQAAVAHKKQFDDAVAHYVQVRAEAATQFKDLAAVEGYVDANLNPDIMAAILFGAKEGTFSNPQNMIYAIGRQPELLKKLNATTNPMLAGAMLLDISQKSQFAPKAPSKPINPIPAVDGAPTGDALAEAKRKARETGNYTEYLRLKAQLKK